MYKLIIQDDEGKTTVVPLIRDEITIGRREGNTIRLTERNVSRKHARILKSNGAVLIEDLDSYNGIRVNGTRIQGRVPVAEADRVQIGDYLLELKLDRGAQAGDPFSDHQSTQPIERTSGIQAVANPPPVPQAPGAGMHLLASTAPTAQLPVADPQTVLGARNGSAGAKNGSSAGLSEHAPLRTSGPMGITAPEVSAIPHSACARLVVLSANFAGREFQLDKATMVIGRTEDNDVVIDHRSISRHHAKIAREHDHFAIVDLQSSNGVRVNGEDYGKVELRPGDQVDLGHVRLRFVEAGEAFVFDPSMIVDLGTDTPKRGLGGKSLLWVALGVAVLLGCVALFIGVGRGRSAEAPVASTETVVGESSPQRGEKVAPNANAEQPAPREEAPPELAEAQTALAAENWTDAIALAKQVLKVRPQSSEATRIVEQATLEIRTEPLYEAFAGAVRRNDVSAVARAFAALPENSAYRAKGEPTHERFKALFVDKQVAEAQRLAQLRQCDKVTMLGKRAGEVFADARIRVEEVGASCQPAGVGVRPASPVFAAKDTRAPPPRAIVTPPPADPADEPPAPSVSGSYDQHFQESKDAWRNGQYQKALAKSEDALNAKPGDQQALEIATIASCKLKNTDKAARYYGRMKGPRKQGVRQVCLTFGVTL